MARAGQQTTFWLGVKAWLLQGQTDRVDGPFQKERSAEPHQQPWWRVMCLTGVDYFSSLGYQPGIAFAAAGALSPIATVVLVLLTLLGALPTYRRVALDSPHGEGSISLIERLLRRWASKLFVLALLGFAATDFIITITLSAADAAAHFVQNPFVGQLLGGQNIAVTMLLVALLGAVFLRGFKEAIGIAVVLVAVYLGLNAVLVARSFIEIGAHPEVWGQWRQALYAHHSSPVGLALVALLVFPKLALGLSGFETGVAVMPLVRGAPDDDPVKPMGRIRSTHKLLGSAAIIMSVFLIATSLVTTLLIPAQAFAPGGEANGRALAYLAHRELGNVFGSAYDVSTILILWFAGASAMAGLLNLVPRYLPRYGMAPRWTRAIRPLVLLFTAVAFAITLIFRADVDAQGGAYATGVLVLMTSAAFVATLATWRAGRRAVGLAFGLIFAVFAYTTVVNVIDRPDGVRIAGLFILGIILVSILSRVLRATELRSETTTVDAAARELLRSRIHRGVIRLIAHQYGHDSHSAYTDKERTVRQETHIPSGDPVVFLEVQVTDPSEFNDALCAEGLRVGEHAVLRLKGASVANDIAAFLLWVRDEFGVTPHVYFEWIKGSPGDAALRFLLFGEGDIAPLTHEVLRAAEPDGRRRPVVHVGG